MVVDKIEHASLYYGLGKRFQTALEWLASADVGALTPGQRVDIGKFMYNVPKAR